MVCSVTERPAPGRRSTPAVPTSKSRSKWLLRVSVGVAVAAAVVALLVWAFYGLPHELIHRGSGASALKQKDLLAAQNDVRTAAIQALGGLAVIVGTVLTARAAFGTIRQTRDGQLTDRFSAALVHLASDKVIEQLGGINELARVARESPLDHWPVMEVLMAFLRECYPADAAPMAGDAPPPVRAIAAVLRERNVAHERPELGQRIDLFKVDLRKARLDGVDLRYANLVECDLRGAFLSGANLADTSLDSADLRGAQVTGIDFRHAGLIGADARGVVFDGGADLREARVTDLDLRERANLRDARYDDAISTARRDETTQLRGA
jgi:Pentapeptide repeats (8 copies)